MDMDISVVIARGREEEKSGVEGEGGRNADGWRLDLRQ